jgi:hypothetical protein
MCFKKTLCIIQDSEVQFFCIRPDDVVFRPDASQSSNIRPDDENFLSGLPSVSATRLDVLICKEWLVLFVYLLR